MNMTLGPGLLSVHGKKSSDISHSTFYNMFVLFTKGPRHRKQRKMLNPVFSIKHMRGLTPLFYSVADRVSDIRYHILSP